MILCESNYVIVIFARDRKESWEDIFFHDTIIRSESNYVIVIFSRNEKESWGRYIFSRYDYTKWEQLRNSNIFEE